MSHDKRKKWTASDVLKIFCNPLIVGIGPFPAVVSEQQWIQAACASAKQVGWEVFLRTMIGELRATLGGGTPTQLEHEAAVRTGIGGPPRARDDCPRCEESWTGVYANPNGGLDCLCSRCGYCEHYALPTK